MAFAMTLAFKIMKCPTRVLQNWKTKIEAIEQSQDLTKAGSSCGHFYIILIATHFLFFSPLFSDS